jgi:penicillin G amidase
MIIALKGLLAPVSIKIDAHGIPHIEAGNKYDLFFAQGFNAARDRLFQMDIWRKKGLGLLAKDFGAGYLAQDYATRLFLYKGDMTAEWSAYGDDAKDICESFTAGINAYIDQAIDLPPEFIALNFKPLKWQAEDCVRIRLHALTRNIMSEVLRSQNKNDHQDALRKFLEPAITPIRHAELLHVPLAVLDLYKLAMANVTFTKARLAAKLENAWHWVKVTELNDVITDHEMTGSNNWVISKARSEDGFPIVANDPHRAHALPGIRYLAHLKAPGINVIGHGEPFNPGIAFGHNEHLAYGLTIFYSDQEDLYFYESGFEFTEIDERFEVRGALTQTLPAKYTKHGPVLFEDFETGRGYALRTVWNEPGAAPYMHALKSMRAGNITEFQAAIKGWGTPSGNIIVADAENIGWFASGFTPIRPHHDGLTPVPGNGAYEWAGMIEDMPQVINPPKGYFATANEYNVPAGYAQTIGYEWIDPQRANRIHEVIDATPQFSISQSIALQTDDFSKAGERVLFVLKALNAPHLLGWNCKTSPESADALLFERWFSFHLKPALAKLIIPDEHLRKLASPFDMETLLRAIESRAYDTLLISTLNEAYSACLSLYGEQKQWRYDRFHHAYFEHPLAEIWGNKHDIGPLSMGGAASSPMMAGYRADGRILWGASVRLVMSVGNWDKSVAINTTGQSGDPRSKHYADLADLWAKGGYIPLHYSQNAVNKACVEIITLQPL